MGYELIMIILTIIIIQIPYSLRTYNLRFGRQYPKNGGVRKANSNSISKQLKLRLIRKTYKIWGLEY